MGTNFGRALSGQALVSDQAASRLAPAGFDPSRASCATCAYATGFADPGDEPQKPEPIKHVPFWGSPIRIPDIGFEIWLHWQKCKHDHQHSMKCRRWPTPQPTMSKAAFCGEYLASGIETRSAETERLGPKDESAVA